MSYDNTFSQHPLEPLTMDKIRAAAERAKAFGEIVSDLTVSPDMLEAAGQVLAKECPDWWARPRLHVDNRLPPRTWHKGRPAEPGAAK